MRRYTLLSTLLALTVFLFQSCRGPEGVPGPQGPEGPPGAELLPAVIDVGPINFNAGNNYEAFWDIDADLAGYESDIVLVYLHYSTENNVKIYRSLPLVVNHGTGFFQFGFDYTMYDVRFFLAGNVDLSTVSNSWTQNNIFRVVILPAENLTRKAHVDLTNYEEVVKAFNIDESKIKTVRVN